jgi:hypothetical protein
MKIVDRKTFLSMPEGTVYCKIQFRKANAEEHAYSHDGWDECFGIKCPSIKGVSTTNDFYNVGLGDFSAKDGDPMDALHFICDNLGTDIPFEMAGGRDGAYDDTHVHFAIFSRDEVQQIIYELQTALRRAY